jgi:RimJ/RimL family protein N-acetyltransferase
MLKGNKVILRAVEREDLKRLHALERNVELALLADGDWQPVPLGQWERNFDKQLEDTDKVHFVIEADGMVIGGIGLHHSSRRHAVTSFGIGIYDPDYIGNGYGRDAIEALLPWVFHIQNYRRIWLETSSTNQRAIRCYRAVGFVEEGRLREHEFLDGKYIDSVLMGLLRTEWQARRALMPDT